MKNFTPPSPEHFAAEGKRVESANEPGMLGTVDEWVSRHAFLVVWDVGIITRCTVFDVEPAPAKEA